MNRVGAFWYKYLYMMLMFTIETQQCKNVCYSYCLFLSPRSVQRPNNTSHMLILLVSYNYHLLVITQPLSIVVGKHFTVTIIKLPNVISRILIIHLLPIYFCTSSWYVRAAICLEGRLSLLALSSVYSLTVEDGSWSTPMVPAQLSVPL